jgi:DNA-binding beta-propeller fold protein YncE
VLKIDGKTGTTVGEIEVGGLPEGAVFSPDGKYLYVGNFLDRDVSILKVEGTRVTHTGKRLQLRASGVRARPDEIRKRMPGVVCAGVTNLSISHLGRCGVS